MLPAAKWRPSASRSLASESVILSTGRSSGVPKSRDTLSTAVLITNSSARSAVASSDEPVTTHVIPVAVIVLSDRNEEVDASWRVIDPLEAYWADTSPHKYRAGEWGPRAADEMLATDGRVWRRP